MERQLNEQWIEELDGKRHMLKAVENLYETCQGCTFGCESCDVCHYCLADGGKCPVNKMDMVIKDLGVLNEDGLLPCPFCGEYPGKRVGNDTWKCGCEIGAIATWQEAIDAWNRRA